jgi:DinB superfamily
LLLDIALRLLFFSALARLLLLCKGQMMNSFIQEQWPMFEGTHAMRTELLDSLTDADLAFTPGGLNMPLGALCREMGEIEYSYVQSLKTFKQDWSYRNTDAGLETSLEKLKTWFQTLDDEMKETVAALSDADLKKSIERGFSVPVDIQMQIYLQALLIFFGKATIYVKAMNRPLSKKFQDWIG